MELRTLTLMEHTGTNNRGPGLDHAWARLPDDKLLDLRLCDLKLKIEGTELQKRVDQLYGELRDRGLRFRPHCWLSNEWFSPDGVPGIAIPFYLAHPRLMKLEEQMMLEVEGGSKTWCMQLLRHETGHAFETAFRLNRRVQWRKLFGSSTRRYPEYYCPKPFSRKHVLHLDWWYAQSHPSEDFAETFAVWLRPGSQWRKRYRGWPALKKLQYVDDLMKSLAGKGPPVRSKERTENVAELQETLREHYRDKQARYGTDYPDFYDRDLRRLFSDSPEHSHLPEATKFLRRVGPEVRNRVASWTGEHPYTVNQLLKEMISRCRELNLRVSRPEGELRVEAAIMLTMQTTNYLHSSGHRLAL